MFTYISFILALIFTLFILHYIRLKKNLNLFLFYVGLLWVTSYILGHLNLAVPLEVGSLSLKLRYSSTVFTIIFAAILLGYLSGGVREARSVIYACITAQFFLIFLTTMHEYAWLTEYPKQSLQGAEILLKPAYGKMLISIGAAVIDLFVSILFFQFLVNRYKKLPRWLAVFLAIEVAMILDSFIFVGLTRPDTFGKSISSHLVLKTFISLLVSTPLSAYIVFLQKRSHLKLNRGILDIFSQIEDLQEDLQKAHEELKEYARTLEQKVEERTKEIIKKQKQMEFELDLATEVQATLLPDNSQAGKFEVGSIYLPCSKVSGDLYTFRWIFDDVFIIFLADISGHGVPAALIGAICSMMLEKIKLRVKTPAEVLRILSDEIEKLESSHYFTGIYLSVHTSQSKIYYANAAHPAALLLEPDGMLIELEPTGSVLGSAVDPELSDHRVKYSPNSKLLVYTDCILETTNPDGEEFGLDRLKEFFLSQQKNSPQEVVESLKSELVEFSQKQEFDDDFTVLCFQLR
ncbi:MAG: hypothetical protein D6767_09190 [Candidatus Hydrogenedentota bacterium]|nr:MAG: hypothetical protein D6767_09190 [Candidatus Hydrogenedentota bacterium]